MPPEAILHNAQAVAADSIPQLDIGAFRASVTAAVASGRARLAALLAIPGTDTARLLAVLAHDGDGMLSLLSCPAGIEYPALTPDCPQAHGFEREIAEAHGIRPVGHPWLKPVRFPRQHPDGAATPPVGIVDFFRMDGEGIHEVAVGPVHAGVIEPGHFRFQCLGETVHHLEISLGYQHRGVERALLGGPGPRTLHHWETLAGDTSIGHAVAGCRAMESLAGMHIPARAQAIRGIAAELERLANHIGDLGALAGDVGFLPTLSFCGRLRGDALNLTALLCGNRFGRGLVVPGGTAWDVDAELIRNLLERLDALDADTRNAVELMFNAPSVMARLEGVGAVSAETARELGLVGIAARACGLPLDARHNFPYGIYRFSHIPAATWTGGDCFARAYVRWLEIERSIAFIRDLAHSLPAGPVLAPARPLAPAHLAVSVTEGWRGEIVHAVSTDDCGRFNLYKVVDPSFHNWFGLAMALRGQQISDFPLCNKSFNLSYCGHDL